MCLLLIAQRLTKYPVLVEKVDFEICFLFAQQENLNNFILDMKFSELFLGLFNVI